MVVYFLYNRHRQKKRYTKAEDVVQEVFIKLLKHRNDEFDDKGHLKAWLIRVTINQCKDLRRIFCRKREVPLQDYDFPFEENEERLMERILIRLHIKSIKVLFRFLQKKIAK